MSGSNEGGPVTISSTPLNRLSDWNALRGHHARLAPVHLRSLFSQDSQRARALLHRRLGTLARLLEE